MIEPLYEMVEDVFDRWEKPLSVSWGYALRGQRVAGIRKISPKTYQLILLGAHAPCDIRWSTLLERIKEWT